MRQALRHRVDCSAMPPSEPSRYVAASFDQLLVVRWRDYRPDDLAAVRRRIAEMHRMLARPILYLSLIPDSPRVFSEAERAALADYLRDLLACGCGVIHHVIDGEGFVASSRRSIVTNMALATARPEVFETHATLEDALAEIAGLLGRVPSELIADAKARGLAFRRSGP
jgi:hypothetical protein